MKKNNVLWICVVLMMAFGISSCSSDDDDDNPIVGTWELKTLGFPGVDIEIPSDQRDVYEFCANGKVKVIKEYDYSYDKKKQIIQLCGVARECVISNGEMHIEGYHDASGEPVQRFIFIKK